MLKYKNLSEMFTDRAMNYLDEQRELIESLQNPACFPHSVEGPCVVETHISWVILTGTFAYKIKKSVDLGFLDFSSLEKRKRCCDEELRLNRRFSPDIYLDVVAITNGSGAPRIGGSGPVLEYAVRMREFPQTALLNHLAEKRQLGYEMLDQLADKLADFHLKAPRVDAGLGVDTLFHRERQYGTFDAICRPIRENFKQINALPPASEEIARKLRFLERWSEEQLERLKPVFAERHAGGYIRECHGDLHLGNIAEINGDVRLFDCIEFNPALRWIDTFSELAFLLMDLEDFGYRREAGRLLNRYLEKTGDYHGLSLLPFYKVYRAMVRAKVNAIRMAQPGIDAAQREQAQAAQGRYLGLAEESTNKRAPFLAIMHGVSGTGKSTVSARVADEYGAVRVRSDVERKRLHDLAANAKSDSELKAGIYSDKSTDKTYARLAQISQWAVDAGYPVMVDATFLSRIKRHDFMAIACDHQIPFFIFDCQASESTLVHRVKKRKDLEQEASEADVMVLKNQMEHQNRLSVAEKHWTIAINTEKEFEPGNIIELINHRNRKITNGKSG